MTSAQTPFPKISLGVEETENPSDFILTIQILALMTILSLAPSILIMMTSFTRIIIVFHFLRAALATQSVPSNQILVGLALFMTLFIMKPVLSEINDKALQPYLSEIITQDEAIEKAGSPIRQFMLNQTREADLQLFVDLKGDKEVKVREDLTLSTIIPAFIISELKTAFQIGFLLYLPMLLLDMVVASVLLSMGMMMLPPVMISMPFKILLFVLVDGWNLIVKSLVEGFV
ncbi:MAG: flagellar type III secretion system pore protein FliP [Candidatus Marinimicrobia bacterium]|nr:flagellar type III secretion system pore protein FliP [Candidatus Neomarinimicrobiota bacterium]